MFKKKVCGQHSILTIGNTGNFLLDVENHKYRVFHSKTQMVIVVLFSPNVAKAKCDFTQCGNFRIFLSFRFYMKPILKDLEVVNMPILPF